MSETAYIVLFRGVGGATQLPVRELRQVLADVGFNKVATYINSGNAVLTSAWDEAKVAAEVSRVVREKLDFEKHVFVRSREEWARMIAANPFVDATAEPTKLHLYTLEREPAHEDIGRLQAKATGSEHFHVEGRALYLHTPEGMGRSSFAPKIEPTLKLAATARNWRTASILAGMVRDL